MFFTILLALVLILAVYGIVSSAKDTKRARRELARAMALIKFDTTECCKCAKREDCKIYIHATGFGNTDSRDNSIEQFFQYL